jgi:hypothetical protein
MNQLGLVIAIAAVSGCVVQQPPASGTYPTRGGYAAPGPQQQGGAYGGGYGGRRVTFNAVPLDDRGWQIVAQLDAHFGRPLPDGDYWYDPQSGAAGAWGGPTLIVLPPAMPLGAGIVPANASGGGDGRYTGVFVNGREIHPTDVAVFEWITGQPVQQGRWWADHVGNFGPEGWAAVGNIYSLAASRGAGGYANAGGGVSWSAGGGAGSTSFWVGGDGNGYNWAMDGASGCSYASDGGGVIC